MHNSKQILRHGLCVHAVVRKEVCFLEGVRELFDLQGKKM